jgi:hypothetical protein
MIKPMFDKNYADKASDENFELFKFSFEENLKKQGLTLSYAGLFQHDWEHKQGGIIVAKFNSNEGYPVTFILNRQYNKGAFQIETLFWTYTIWSTIVPATTPFTLFFKEIHPGFMKESVKVFLPYCPPADFRTFKEKEALNSPLMQTKLVTALNSDKSLCDEIDYLKLEYSYNLGSDAMSFGKSARRKVSPYELGMLIATQRAKNRTLSFKTNDFAGKCAIVPVGNETAVFLRDFGPGNLFPMSKLSAMTKIRKQILAYPHAEKVVGAVADANWITAAYSLTRASIP